MFYPKTQRLPVFLNEKVIKAFIDSQNEIDSSLLTNVSNHVLRILSHKLEEVGFKVEKGKSADEKIKVPVLFGKNGSIDKYFDADAYHADEKIVLEVEAGRAVSNNQFIKDLFQACVMSDVDYLVIAVHNT